MARVSSRRDSRRAPAICHARRLRRAREQSWRAGRVARAARLVARRLLHRERVTAMDGSKPGATCYFPVFSGRDCRADDGFQWQISMTHPRIARFQNEPTVQIGAPPSIAATTSGHAKLEIIRGDRPKLDQEAPADRSGL